jgi:hypothetical protein
VQSPGALKPSASRLLRMIHKRALWTAMRAAGGDAAHAARALGITVPELMELLDGDPASMWSPTGPRNAISGARPKVDPPAIDPNDEEDRTSDDDPDKAAW